MRTATLLLLVGGCLGSLAKAAKPAGKVVLASTVIANNTMEALRLIAEEPSDGGSGKHLNQKEADKQ